MNAVDCTAFNPFSHEVCLPPSSPPSASEADQSEPAISTPSGFPSEARDPDEPVEILIPGVDWEYVAEYPLLQLKLHSLQNELFVGLNEHSIDELAQDIRRRGLQNPLEILPNGTIINGHQRFLAYQRLRQTDHPGR
jgi:hypothetical protein